MADCALRAQEDAGTPDDLEGTRDVHLKGPVSSRLEEARNVHLKGPPDVLEGARDVLKGARDVL